MSAIAAILQEQMSKQSEVTAPHAIDDEIRGKEGESMQDQGGRWSQYSLAPAIAGGPASSVSVSNKSPGATPSSSTVSAPHPT